MYDEIIKQQIESDIDVIVGMGTKLYDPMQTKLILQIENTVKPLKDIKEAITNKRKCLQFLKKWQNMAKAALLK